MRRKVILHGALARDFGDSYELDVASAREAARALATQLPGFGDRVAQGYFRVWSGPLEVDHELLDFQLGSLPEINIMPVVAGSGGDSGMGVGKIVAGIALVGLAVAFAPAGAGLLGANMGASIFGAGILSYGTVAMFGVSMILGGISMMLAPGAPKVKSQDYQMRERPEERASFVFNGAVNTMEQGGPVPIIYGGPIRVGSVVISAGMTVEQMMDSSGVVDDGQPENQDDRHWIRDQVESGALYELTDRQFSGQFS